MHRYRSEIIICLLLVTGILAVFWQVHNHDFVNYDDKAYVTKNRHVRAGWTIDGLTWAFTTRHHSHWHPVTWMSHMTDIQLFGLNPGRHHLSSLLLHIINTLLLFLVFNRMTNTPLRSGMVAALFAFHPLHVESVAWVADRKDVLSAFFWMLSMWAYIRYTEQPGIGRYLPVVLLFMLALMSKPMVVTFPLVLILIDYWPLGRLQDRSVGGAIISQPDTPLNTGPAGRSLYRILAEKVLLLLPVVASVIITVAIMNLRRSRPLNLSQLLPTISLIKESLFFYVVYIGKMLYPASLAVPYAPLKTMLGWEIAGAGSLLIGITFLAFWKRRQYPYLAVGWLWYLITISPVTGLVPVGPRQVADRYTYIPLIGLFIMIAWGIPDLLARLRRRQTILAIAGGLLITGLMICSWLQVRHWKDSVTLFTHTVNVTAGNYTTQNNLGVALLGQGRHDEAVYHFSEALKIKPGYVHARINMGVALAKQGKLEAAKIQYRKVLRRFPNNAMAYYNLGIVSEKQKRLQEAIRQYSKAVQLKPDYAEAHNKLGIVLANQGKLVEAAQHFSKAVRIKPDYAEAHNKLGIVLANQGKLAEAAQHFSKAVRINPGHSSARNNLKRALHLMGQSSGESKKDLKTD